MYVKSAIFYHNFRVWLFIPVNGLIFRESINNINRCVLNCSGEKKRGKKGGKKEEKKKSHDPNSSRAKMEKEPKPKWTLEQAPNQGCSLISKVLALNWQLHSTLASWVGEKAGNFFKTHLNEALRRGSE